jgi:glycosyltransferase involved in cell wall biosynthesis
VSTVPPSLDIIVPVYNEEDSIDEFMARMRRLGYAEALLFVDNASTDGTVERIRRSDARLVRHTRNEGYGASIRDGIVATSGELIVVIDADLEYPPEAIPAIVDALATHPVVYASRFLGPTPPDMPAVRRLGNQAATRLYDLLFSQRTTDLQTGMKGLRRGALPLATLRRPGFEHTVELGTMITLAGHRIHDVPVEYQPRQHGRSKMRHVPEVAKLLSLLVGYWMRCVLLRRPLPA